MTSPEKSWNNSYVHGGLGFQCGACRQPSPSLSVQIFVQLLCLWVPPDQQKRKGRQLNERRKHIDRILLGLTRREIPNIPLTTRVRWTRPEDPRTTRQLNERRKELATDACRIMGHGKYPKYPFILSLSLSYPEWFETHFLKPLCVLREGSFCRLRVNGEGGWRLH